MNRPMSVEWIEEFSVERYRPMNRLLDREDFEFLSAQPGITAVHIATLRVQRCRILRGYLHFMNEDFKRICMAVKLLLAESKEDRADLAGALLRRQALFTCAMFRVQCRLVLFSWGVGSVDVSGLLRLFDGMRSDLMMMVPAAA